MRSPHTGTQLVQLLQAAAALHAAAGGYGCRQHAELEFSSNENTVQFPYFEYCAKVLVSTRVQEYESNLDFEEFYFFTFAAHLNLIQAYYGRRLQATL